MECNSSLMTVLFIFTTSILTAVFAFWTFRSQKWWELKVKTYTSIMESLHYIKKYNDLDYDQFNENYNQHIDKVNTSSSKEKQNKIKKAMALFEKPRDKALQEIEKAIDVSSFIIDRKALEELIKLKNHYMHDIEDYDDIDEYVEGVKTLIDACVNNIRTIAKKDIETMPNMAMDALKRWWESHKE